MTTAIRILIADDHTLLRGHPPPAGEPTGHRGRRGGANGEDALAAVDLHRPDIVLTDIAMPMMNGLELAARLGRDFPGIKTIILSIHSEEEYICRALQAGDRRIPVEGLQRQRAGPGDRGGLAGRFLPEPGHLQACHLGLYPTQRRRPPGPRPAQPPPARSSA